MTTRLQDNQTTQPITRRDSLTLFWKGLLSLAGMLGLAGLFRYLDYQPTPSQPTIFDVGTPDQYPSGSRTVIAAAEAILINDAGRYSALSLVCPHLGCQLNTSPDGFACPCHGSRFRPDGSLKRGPATRGMKQLKLSLNNSGHLILDISG